jgi:hypothetical protein
VSLYSKFNGESKLRVFSYETALSNTIIFVFYWGFYQTALSNTILFVFYTNWKIWAKMSGPCPAVLGQSVIRLKQASSPWSIVKNQFNIGARLCLACQILSWQEQILHMILAKRPRSDERHIIFQAMCFLNCYFAGMIAIDIRRS